MNKMRRLQLKRVTSKLCEIEDVLIKVRDGLLKKEIIKQLKCNFRWRILQWKNGSKKKLENKEKMILFFL